jgi:hypothetical protein
MCAALVTGGSQGVGKGIVEGLAEAGHQVFFTGRDPGRLERTAAEASALGGEVFPRRVDHGSDEQVRALFAEIAENHRLDLLVNNAWGGYEKMLDSPHINVVSLYPGMVRTEKVMAAAEHMDLSNSESPRFIGRTIAALFANREMRRKLTGQVCVAAQVARDLGIEDMGGNSPKPLTLEDI